MIFLMVQKQSPVYYILNSDTDYIGAMSDGKLSIMNTDCLASAKNMPDLLHQLQESKCGKWYVETDWLGSDGKYRHDEYPQHQGLHRLDGFIKKVCDIRKSENCYFRDWEVNYISELWFMHSDYDIKRVVHFNENMLFDVKNYMKEHGLHVHMEIL